MASIISRSLRLNARNPFPRALIRRYTTEKAQPQQPQYQAPEPASSPSQSRPNPHREFYSRRGAGRAVAFNFLIAMATFQVLYLGWLKLESLEIKKEKNEEIEKLQGELKTLKGDGNAN